MAGPVSTYITTQTAAQTAFTVPFGLLTLVNGAIATATAAGLFNTTVDCSLFVTEDVSNLRIYLDSLGYKVDFAKNTGEKSLNIDWGKFLDDATDATTVYQGTVPWIVAGTVTADQGAPGAAPWLVSVTNTITVDQGTTPWMVTGTITTSPDVNVHDGSGNAISSTGTSLDVNVTNFPAMVAVTQSTSPWVIAGSVAVTNFPAVQPISGTVTALQGTFPWTVDGTINAAQSGAWTVTANQGTTPWTIDGVVNAVQSGVWTTGRTWTLASGTDSVAAVQSGTWTVQQGTPPWSVSVTNFPAVQPVSGTITALQGTTPWLIDGTVAAAQSGAWTTGRTWTLASGTDSVSAVQSGTWTVQQGTPPWSVSQSGAWTVVANQGTTPWVSNITQFGSSNVVTGTGASGLGIPRVTISNDSNILATQSGTWTTGRTWALSNATDSVVAFPTGTQDVNIVGNSSASVTNVTASATNITLLASNSARKMALIFNDSSQTLFLKFGATASMTSYTVEIGNNEFFPFPLPIYTGQVDGLWSTATGTARITEY